MKKIIFVISVVLGGFCHSSYAEYSPTDRVNQTITNLMQKNHIAGAAVVLIDHGHKAIYVYGTTAGKPVTEKTLFELGCITKVMTTLILAEAIQNHQYSLQNTLTDYLPIFAKNSTLKKITLLQLATHTSGLPFNQPTGINTWIKLNLYLLNWGLDSPPQMIWQYSNLGIGLVGHILTTKSHQSAKQLFANDIFIPLVMKSSRLTDRPDSENLLNLFRASWAAESNAQDMENFLSAAIGLPNTPNNISIAMQFSQTPRVKVGNMQQALGWQVYTLKNLKLLLDTSQYIDLLKTLPAQALPKKLQIYNPNTLIDKTGATNGFRTYIAVIPGRQSGIVILLNKYISTNKIVYAGRKILLSQ